ncbi:MAG: YHS domain-containing protein [Bryobacteraceae bacterium]
MDVDPNTAKDKSSHQGHEYTFCGPGCKSKFDRNPAQYAPEQAKKS